MKNQIAKFGKTALKSNQLVDVKGGAQSANNNLPQVPANGIFYPCGLPVVSHP